MRLKSKYVDLALDHVPDSDTLKALTPGVQTIAGQVTFSRAPRVSATLIEPDGDNLVTRGQVEAVIDEIKAASAGIHWEITEDGARIITNPPYVPTPTPKPTCHIEYRTEWEWRWEISWFCLVLDGPPDNPGQSYDPERGVICVPQYERKLVEVRKPYEVCA